MQDYKQLKVWEKSHRLVLDLYPATASFPKSEQYSLTSQLRRACMSVPGNIAEGCGKFSRREKIRYYSYALDSAKECIPCLTIAYRQKQVSQEENARAREACTIICRMLGKLIKSVEDAELKKG